VEVIAGPRVSVDVLELIERAQDKLLLVSPYFKPWGRLEQSIQNAVMARGVDTTLLLRGGRDRKKQYNAAKPIEEAGAHLVFLKRLHAKVYLSESEAVLTSMNLLESSALDSWEIAMRISKDKDAGIYEDVVAQCEKMMLQAAQAAAREKVSSMREKMAGFGTELFSAVTSGPSKGQAATKDSPKSSKSASSGEKGSCIRCAKSIKLDIKRPLCKSCWKLWSKFKNEDYEEKYCLGCGKEHKTSFAKPMCYGCYKKFA
jgi:phosphatidylserine/phosphatidylglycerophosphate/cardiolipin synthase-like enzyme